MLTCHDTMLIYLHNPTNNQRNGVPEMKTLIARKKWEEQHAARFGAPAGVDEKLVEITSKVLAANGRTYLTETHYCNGIVTQTHEYPAGTDYAAKRIAACN